MRDLPAEDDEAKRLTDWMAQAIFERLTAADTREPLVYSDQGIALLRAATAEVWEAMDPIDRQRLIDASHRFVIECLR
jgi:hypothetical protein